LIYCEFSIRSSHWIGSKNGDVKKSLLIILPVGQGRGLVKIRSIFQHQSYEEEKPGRMAGNGRAGQPGAFLSTGRMVVGSPWIE